MAHGFRWLEVLSAIARTAWADTLIDATLLTAIDDDRGIIQAQNHATQVMFGVSDQDAIGGSNPQQIGGRTFVAKPVRAEELCQIIEGQLGR